jgi:tRNA-dihydrouridine synthase B
MNTGFWQETIAFGNLKVPRFMSAPLDGITDSPFRQLIRDFSPHEMLMTEMRHIALVCHEKTGISLAYNPIEQPLAFQFSGNSTNFLPEAVEKVITNGFVMINLNAGCPARVVIKSGSGSALMANLPQLEILMKAFVSAINGRVPFTLKIRAGFKEKNALDVAKLAVDCGVEGIIVHPRTQPEGFASLLDYDLVRSIKQTVKVPVVFSGNINSFTVAQKVHDRTGVDGFMIGRALWGAPWKIKEITAAAAGESFTVDTATMLQYAQKHLALNVATFGPRGFIPFKKQLPLYIRSINDASTWRSKLLRSQSAEEMQQLLATVMAENSPEKT